jgi:xylulokinase
MRILALDVGTSSVKAAVLDVATTRPVGPIARLSYELDFPTPDAAEVPAERLWQAVMGAAREATRTGVAVDGVGMSCLTPALVLLDKADQPICPIWTHLDRRARPVARQVWNDVGAEFLQTVGNRPLPGGITALCFRQILEDDPKLRPRVHGFLHVNGWLGLRLTGARAFDRANACFTGLFGTLTDQQWSSRWCDFFDVERAWLPPVLCGSATIGSLRANVAAELGVPAGIPVKLGTADTSCAMLAAGMKPGDLLHVVGTTQVVAAIVHDPRPSPRRLTRLLGVGAAFIQVTHNPVGGVALDWMRQLCFRDQTEQEFYERTIPEARRRSVTVALEPPFLGGDRLEIEAQRAAFRDLTLATDRLDLLAAVLDAMVRSHREALAALDLPRPPERICLTGGGAHVIRQLIPEYAEARVELVEDGSLRGVTKLFAAD